MRDADLRIDAPWLSMISPNSSEYKTLGKKVLEIPWPNYNKFWLFWLLLLKMFIIIII